MRDQPRLRDKSVGAVGKIVGKTSSRTLQRQRWRIVNSLLQKPRQETTPHISRSV